MWHTKKHTIATYLISTSPLVVPLEVPDVVNPCKVRCNGLCPFAACGLLLALLVLVLVLPLLLLPLTLLGPLVDETHQVVLSSLAAHLDAQVKEVLVHL